MTTYGIDANPLTRKNRTGTEWYLFHLLKNMMKTPLQKDERVLLYSSSVSEDLGELPNGWEWMILKWPLKLGWTKGRLSLELLTRPPDVFFSPAHEIRYVSGRTQILSTIHDIAFEMKPELYPVAEAEHQKKAVKRQIQKSDRIITVSEASKSDLMSAYSVDEEKITVTHLGVDPEQFQIKQDDQLRILDKYGLKAGEYFFFVGRLEAKKNIANLVRAFTKYAETNDLRLVLGGKMGFESEKIQRAIDNSGAKDRIQLLGYVPDADVAPLIGGAVAFLFPSFYEGFGLPALESMASGTPLLASDIPVLREIAGEAALFASPDDIDSWAMNMEKIQNDSELRGSLVLQGSALVHDFSWEKTAESTWDVLRSLD